MIETTDGAGRADLMLARRPQKPPSLFEFSRAVTQAANCGRSQGVCGRVIVAVPPVPKRSISYRRLAAQVAVPECPEALAVIRQREQVQDQQPPAPYPAAQQSCEIFGSCRGFLLRRSPPILAIPSRGASGL